MAEPVKIHPVPRRDGIEYYMELACPDCGAPVFVLEDEPAGSRVDDLTLFGPHRCGETPLASRPDGPHTLFALPIYPAGGFPVDLGRIPDGAAHALRAAVETVFGKRLVRYVGVFRRKGLPIHYTPDWKPLLGHVPGFSKSDVHRPLNPGVAIFERSLPHVQKHFAKDPPGSHRKYFFSTKGVIKHDRSGARPVIVWMWPSRVS